MVFGRPLKELRWLEETEERRSGETQRGGGSSLFLVARAAYPRD